MFKGSLRTLRSSQSFQLFLLILSLFFSSVVFAEDENLPPLFFNETTQTEEPELAPITELTATTGTVDTDLSTEESMPPQFIDSQDAERTEFIVADKPKQDPSSILKPLSDIGRPPQSLQELWLKTLPSKQAPTAEYIPEAEQQSSEYEEPAEEVADSKGNVEDNLVTDKKEPQEPIISIIIDDLGYTRQGMNSALKLPVEVTLAILPHTPFATATAATSKQQERMTILHVPMDNIRKLNLGPGGLYDDMKEENFKQTLTDDINSVPGVMGINNHMGSLLTQDKKSMEWVMETIKPMKLFFVDSVTSNKSVAFDQAQLFGLTSTKRDVFLDNLQTEDAINKQFERLIRIAKAKGKALAIGHPHPATMSYLLKRLPELEQENIKLVSLNEYMAIP